MVTDQEGDRDVNHQPFTLEPLPRKVENFIQRRDQTTRERINAAFEYITYSPFHHENPTTIRPLRGQNKRTLSLSDRGYSLSFTELTETAGLIRIVQIDNRGDIY